MNIQDELYKSLQKQHDIELALNESSIVAITNSRGEILFANNKFCEVAKYNREELIGQKQSIVNSGYHSKDFFKEMWRTIGTGHVWHGEIKNRAKDGSFYWVDTTIVPFLNDKGKPYQYIAIRHEITQLKEYEEKMEKLAYFDSLTSLPNQNFLNKWLSEQEKKTDLSITVLFLDLDRYKSVNDNFGHRFGDILLVQVAKRLKDYIGKDNFVIRLAGDEFVIVLNAPLHQNKVITIAKEILEGLSYPYFIENEKISITTSIGISKSATFTPEDNYSEALELLIRHADIAMYQVKKNGGNNYYLSETTQHNETSRYFEIEQELLQAFEEKEFYLVYQPLVDLRNNQIQGVEALLRWDNPKLGKVGPNLFVPILEKLGLIIPVGKWIIKTVADQMKKWQAEGTNINRVSINLSPRQFNSNHFTKDVNEILTDTKLDPRLIEFEITEGTILDIEKSTKTLNELKAMGIKIAIDDFGTGYSSLSYLKQLPIDTLKIDKSFIEDLTKEDDVIVNTIINMAKNLNFKVLAEGIENEQQLQYLRNQNCHEGQGYYWSKPVSAEEFQAYYKQITNK